MVNFDLDFQPLDLTNVIPQSEAEVVPVLVQKSLEASEGLFGLGILLVLFIVLITTLTRQEDVDRMDFVRSVLFSGGICLIIGILMLAGNIVSSFKHVVWFGMIFLLALFGSYYMKRKGQ